VERDESGKIVRVIHAKSVRANPLNDPLNALSDDEFEGFGAEAKNEVVMQLEEQASRVAERKPRMQSVREKEWCQRLVERWGEDYRGMARDRRLNPMQQTEADVRRRVEKWRAERGD
jgi:nucleolar protein 16